MTKKLHRPKYGAKGQSTYEMNLIDPDQATIITALFLLQHTHEVPPELYAIVEQRKLGGAIIKRAEQIGDLQLIDDAIAQWG